MSSHPLHYSLESVLSDVRFNVAPESSDISVIRASIAEAEERLFSVLYRFPGGFQKRTKPLLDVNAENSDVSFPYHPRDSPPFAVCIQKSSPWFFLHLILDVPLAIGRQQEFPIVAVSFHWRAVALSTPSLWSRFSLSLRGGDSAFRMLQLCLSRAKASPLTIEIRKDADLRPSFHAGMVEHLIQNSNRWLRIYFPLDYRLLSLFASVRGRLSSLEVASFACPSSTALSEPSDHSLEDIDAFQLAPKLCSLSLRDGTSDVPLFPLEQLERVLFTNMSNASIVLMMAKSPSLRSLTCRWSGNWTDPDPEAPPSIFASLTTIDFKGDYHLLRYLTAPRLESLSLTDVRQISGSMLPAFLQCSHCNVGKLLLDGVWAHWTLIVEALRLIPTLHTLTILDGRPNSVADKALEALAIDPGAVIPGLRNFTLHGSYLFRTSQLLHMLESRVTNVPGQLRLVDLRLDQREFAERDLERFRGLKRIVGDLLLKRLHNSNSPLNAKKVCTLI
ncbi:hypothetical protein B0H14DRAFT_3853632 [Mycena olivaceomarginata]|nr:hypothetical protein B0H14DRAFT_3853632 [Mycena olivaceomarginata]